MKDKDRTSGCHHKFEALGPEHPHLTKHPTINPTKLKSHLLATKTTTIPGMTPSSFWMGLTAPVQCMKEDNPNVG